MAYDDPARAHSLIEAVRLGFADARKYVGDIDHMKVPPEALLADDYIAKRRALISPDAAIPHVEAGSPSAEMRGDTARSLFLSLSPPLPLALPPSPPPLCAFKTDSVFSPAGR